MKRSAAILLIGSVLLISIFARGTDVRAEGKSGEALFKEHCALCHPDGGNIVNPKKTLHKKDLDANKIKAKDDIVKIMRKPGPGMTTFDAKLISDKDAKEIAEYILKTFKK
ncbi:MAG: c-type cytochrome [Nitrospirota bacterium]